MKLTPPRLSAHRFARYVTWARALIIWAAALLLGLVGAPAERHLRQRGGVLSLHRLARIVRTLIVIRASQLCRHRRCRIARNGQMHHRGRARPTAVGRAAFGSALRRALRHRETARRLSLLLDALANIDAFAARCAKRLERRLTRLYPVLTFEPSAERVLTLWAPMLGAADTS